MGQTERVSHWADLPATSHERLTKNFAVLGGVPWARGHFGRPSEL